MRPFPPRRLCVLGLLALPLSCDAPTPAGPTEFLLDVVDIRLESINPYYPDRAPDEALNSILCQVRVDVVVRLPDECTAFGRSTLGSTLEFEGNTFRYQAWGSRPAGTGYCGGPVVTAETLCLPGLGAEPAPPALPPGHYVVIVNGFVGGFDLP